ncbi:hypothetical protein [Nocardioides sp. SYSU DS0663]|uniref:hypothetical protein n=1 Tax=Nocardioides sp. SYSU DS0663 TaxID=3416445 RepID=UPI003F4C55BA
MAEDTFAGELEAVERDAAEQRRLAGRLDRGKAAVAAAEAAVTGARARLVAESPDVARLETFSPTRIWAGLRGSREVDLDRERAEEQAAEYAVAQAEAERLRARAEVELAARREQLVAGS